MSRAPCSSGSCRRRLVAAAACVAASAAAACDIDFTEVDPGPPPDGPSAIDIAVDMQQSDSLLARIIVVADTGVVEELTTQGQEPRADALPHRTVYLFEDVAVDTLAPVVELTVGLREPLPDTVLRLPLLTRVGAAEWRDGDLLLPVRSASPPEGDSRARLTVQVQDDQGQPLLDLQFHDWPIPTPLLLPGHLIRRPAAAARALVALEVGEETSTTALRLRWSALSRVTVPVPAP